MYTMSASNTPFSKFPADIHFLALQIGPPADYVIYTLFILFRFLAEEPSQTVNPLT
jgi:hypothetical protein